MHIRKLAIIAAIGLCPVVISTSWAQQVSLGLKSGVTVSKFHSPALESPVAVITFDTDRRIGFFAVGFAEWIAGKHVSLISEVGYTERGYSSVQERRDEENMPTGKFRIDERMQYITTMVLGKVSVAPGFHAPYVILGPRLDKLIGPGRDEAGSLHAALSSTSWGGTIGVGLPALRHSSVVMSVELRANVDAKNVLPDVPRDGYHRAIDFIVSFRV